MDISQPPWKIFNFPCNFSTPPEKIQPLPKKSHPPEISQALPRKFSTPPEKSQPLRKKSQPLPKILIHSEKISTPPENSQSIENFSIPPLKISQPIRKKFHSPPIPFHFFPNSFLHFPPKNLKIAVGRGEFEHSNPPPALVQKKSYKVCIVHCWSYIARQSILSCE